MNANHALVWIVVFAGVLGFARIDVSVAGDCQTASGDFTAVRPQTCSSPVGICTHGTLKGDFPSTYDFVADTLQPANDPKSPTNLSTRATVSSRPLKTGSFLVVTPGFSSLKKTVAHPS